MVNHIHGRYGHTHSKAGKGIRTTTPRTTSHIRPTHPRKTTRTQPLPQTREMHLRTTSNRIPRHISQPRHSTDGRQKGRKGEELATTNKCNRSTKIPGLHRMLSILHPRLFTHRPTTPRSNHQNHTMALGKRPTKSI